MRVLMAEDDPVSRTLLQTILEKWGHAPVVACDGREALSILEGADAPEIAILDWMMPEMDGPEICRRIRLRTPVKSAYIILLTAKSQREDLAAGLAAGADDYVSKPFDIQELHARFQTGVRVVHGQRCLFERARELEVLLNRLCQLQQGQKLEALGQMASAIAHEINTPLQYLGDNLRFFRDSWMQVDPIVRQGADNPEMDYLLREVPRAINDSLQGTEKVTQIVRAIRNFSGSSGGAKVPVDVNQAIETTLIISTSEWKHLADVTTSFDPKLPRTLCFPGELHQVLLDLIVNATHAIADVKADTHKMGMIRITTTSCEDYVEIRISDTGTGIRAEHRHKIFEPFFTTKAIGRGSGQSLAMAYSIVVQQHNGRIWFDSEAGMGTTFFVRLPIDGIGENVHERDQTNSVH
jgi:two-component system NtrC family sensor kinase